MTYEVIFSDKAIRQLKKMEKTVQERIIATLERIRIRPEKYVTKLVGDPGYKLRVGDHRIIMDIDNKNLHIMEVFFRGVESHELDGNWE
ncbi:MAG: type II toxin-antitoxin system RelE/ParE family toxin [Candidatus Methanoperedens sp.]|nr:type II toxin-antitoxin system RelE/ParE family toxin [Candidatus Methanoperedens sp.]